MQFQGAVVKEQGVTFAIAVVKSHVLSSPTERDKAQMGFSLVFPGLPMVLAAQEGGRWKYYGRPDIIKFLASISPSRIPWKTYTLQ